MAKNNIKKTGGQSWEHGQPKTDGNYIRPFKRVKKDPVNLVNDYG